MYLPPHFEETDHSAIEDLIIAFPLATLVCLNKDEMVVNHIPLLFTQKDEMLGHIALANNLHEIGKDGLDAVAIFKSEDAYISANVYPTKQETHKVVPTWNYQVVHIHGRIEFDHSIKAKREAVGRLTKLYETRKNGAQAWKMADAPNDYMDTMLGNIVSFRFHISRIIAKSKLSQNKEQQDYTAVQEEMDKSNKPQLSSAMKRFKQDF